MFTLFNLQGALGVFHRVLLRFIVVFTAQRSLFILAHLFSFVNTFFQFLLKLFSASTAEVSVFFRFSRSSLHIIHPKTPFVNTFFQFFSTFYSFVYIAFLITIPCGFPMTCIQYIGRFHGLQITVIKFILILSKPMLTGGSVYGSSDTYGPDRPAAGGAF